MLQILAPILAVVLGQQGTGRIQNLVFQSADIQPMLYGLSVPARYDAKDQRPLVLALHPGGGRTPYYGSAFMAQVVAPALGSLNPIMIAPDCPTRSWADPVSEKAVLALIEDTLKRYSIDRSRILVVGFSLGGRGTWFMASHHPDLFTAAIPMAASTGDDPIERLGTIPTYVIHSRDDEVVPFEPAERNARALEKLGRPVRFEALEGIGHFQMGGYIDSLQRGVRWVTERWKQKATVKN
jgi:predicted peptidase